MLKILTIVGARPQFIKAAALSRAIKNHFSDKINEVLLHTGQHYDQNMSQVFFDEMQVPKPDHNLQIGSASHGEQTAKMIEGIEKILLSEKPNATVVYGDTNSTLAGAIASVKLHVPVIHIEAGLRSFNKAMPEEINRVLTDHASTLLFTPTKNGIANLKNENVGSNVAPYNLDNPGVFHCGDIMYDNSLHFASIAEEKSDILSQNGLEADNFILATIHRNNNTDDESRLLSIVNALLEIAKSYKVFLPVHPRTKSALSKIDASVQKKLSAEPNIILSDPASFLDMVLLEKNARMVLTDSGGVQKESFFFKKPCLVLRPESEWIELIENGNNFLVDADTNKILSTFKTVLNKSDFTYPDYYGDGKAAEFICQTIVDTLG